MGTANNIHKETAKVIIVIPAYNEALVIENVVQEISKKAVNDVYRIIVVNDGSTDNTAAVIKKIPKVLLVNHRVNLGAGAATRTGLKAAHDLGADYVITIDADGQHNIDDALHVLADAQKTKADLTIGSRLKNRQGMPAIKVFGNKLLNLVSYLLMGVMVSDSQSGLRVLSKKSLQEMNYHSNGYAFCSEMIWRAKKQGLLIAESPIGAIYSDYSKGKGQKNVAGFFAIISSLAKHRISGFLNE